MGSRAERPSFSRRTLLKGGAIFAASGILAGCEKTGRAQDIRPISTPTPIPIITPTPESTVPASNENLATEVPFTSRNFPYQTEIPAYWQYKPGLAYDKEADIFYGDYHDNLQTMIWAYATPVDEGTTPQEYLDEVVGELRTRQLEALQKYNIDPSVYPEPEGTLGEEGFLPEQYQDASWTAGVDMPGTTKYIHQVHGFIHDNTAWNFNLMYASLARHDGDPDDFSGYFDMLNKFKLINK